MLFRLLVVVASLVPFARCAEDAAANRSENTSHPVGSVLEAQVELHRRGFSCGSIDGVMGTQTAGALRAFQRANDLDESGMLDAPTREKLQLTAPALLEREFTFLDVAGLKPVPATWLEKSERDNLGYGNALELIAERFRANPKLLRELNPAVAWDSFTSTARIKVPAVEQVTITKTPARVIILLADHELEATDEEGAIVFHCPVSIARMAEKRPVGELHVTVLIPNPNYTFDPELFPESEEGRELGRKLVIPPGPNNPVGVAWIGLDRPGYGIHGTPEPEKIGRTESHGCFRLANWDAATVLGLVRVGMPVIVNP